MRSVLRGALFVLALAVAAPGLTAIMGDAVAHAQPKKHPVVRKALVRTSKVLVLAHKAAKKGGEGKALYRKALVQQLAARRALKNDKPALAAALTLRARANAREVIKANKGELPKDLAMDAAEETQAATGATDADVDAACAEVDKEVPAEDQVLDTPPSEETDAE